MRLVTFYVPGLMRRHVESGALPALDARPPRYDADLVPSFPGLRATVSASIDTGTPPILHGILFEDDLPLDPQQDVFACLRDRLGLPLHAAVLESDEDLGRPPREGILRLEYGRLAEALGRGGHGSRAERTALSGLDAMLGRVLDLGAERLLLHGSAALRSVHQRLSAEEVLGGPGRTVRAEQGVAWVRGDGSELAPALREDALGRPGIARVLGARALELHGAPTTRGVAVVCEEGWGFSADRVRPTLAGAEAADSPVVLGWGPPREGSWPTAVHDYRLAPSLAQALGAPLETPFDTALPL